MVGFAFISLMLTVSGVFIITMMALALGLGIKETIKVMRS